MLTVTLSAGSEATLDSYAALHAQTYGEKVDAAALVPQMVAAFMVRDRSFRRKITKRPLAEAPARSRADI